MATKPKSTKKKMVYEESYKKGTYFNELDSIKEHLNQEGVIVYALKATKYDDGTESLTITIDNIK